jgi:DNA-binding winged helix-turn-helix (wHTH) protein
MRDDVIRFGSFRFSPAGRQLCRDGQVLQIGGRALDILAALIEGAGEVVSHRELMTKVWRDIVVDSGNLRVNIAQLRKVLGDAGDVIQNVPRRGYRFVAPILLADDRRQVEELDAQVRILLDCSCGLLPESERLVLCRLSIFAGAFTPDAGQYVASDAHFTRDGVTAAIEQLVKKSLLSVVVATDGSANYRLLEITRKHARARLHESGDIDTVARRHAEYFARPLEASLEEQVLIRRDILYRTDIDQLRNVRAALQWCLERDESRNAMTA